MKTDPERTIDLAELIRDASAVGEAVLACDLAEARFRVHLVACRAELLGMQRVVQIAELMELDLRRDETAVLLGVGATMLRLADEIDRVAARTF